MPKDPIETPIPAEPVTPAPAGPVAPAPKEETPPFMEGIIDPTQTQVEAKKVLTDPDADTPVPGEEPKPGEELKPGEETPPAGEETPTLEDAVVVPVAELTDKQKTVIKEGVDKLTDEQKETYKEILEEKPAVEVPAAPESPTLKEEKDKQVILDRALDKGITEKEITERISSLVSKPLIKVDAPNPDFYKDKKDGSFDIQSYLQDYMNKVVVELQKSIAGGRLGAIQFGILKRAIQDENSERVQAIKTDEAAKTTWDSLTKKFPILKTEEVADKFERAVYGEKYRRASKAKAEGKEYVDLNYADYEKLAADVVGGQPSPAPAGAEPTEALSGSPQLSGGGTRGKDPVGDDIDDMMGLKKKTGVLF